MLRTFPCPEVATKLEKADPVDEIQQRIASYAHDFDHRNLSPEAIHAAKARVIDTLAALAGGFAGEPCQVARKLAGQAPDGGGATIIGTRMQATPDMAAFVNATTARYIEFNDVYFWPGSIGGHPSDVIMPLLGVAEYVNSPGPEFLSSIVLAYEIYCRLSDQFQSEGFDYTNLGSVSVGVAAAKLMGLSHEKLSNAVSMALVPNNILTQVRRDHLSMFKAVAAGHAGRSGVFAAMLARAGMEGPNLPFQGTAGWCRHVAKKQFSLGSMGGEGEAFKIFDTMIKPRPACGLTISPILAAEKIAPMQNLEKISHVTVEVSEYAKRMVGSGEHRWNPMSRETADHSIPYVVAATLLDGTVTPGSFLPNRLWDEELRSLIQKIEVVVNDEFTKACECTPMEHHARVTVAGQWTGELAGESRGGEESLSVADMERLICKKFGEAMREAGVSHDSAEMLLARLWRLEQSGDMAAVLSDLTLQ